MHSHTLASVGRLGRGKRLPRLPARKPVSLLLRQLGKVGRHAPRVVTQEQNPADRRPDTGSDARTSKQSNRKRIAMQ